MKRLASPRKNRFLRWLHHRLGLVALYKYASQYGESYVRPALLLLGVLLAFSLLYPGAGLRYSPGKGQHAIGDAGPLPQGITQEPTTEAAVLTYWHPFRPGEQKTRPRWRSQACLAWHSLWASVFVAFFQRDLVYEPVYLLGRAMAVSEQALTSTLFALFLLSVRRRFRR